MEEYSLVLNSRTLVTKYLTLCGNQRFIAMFAVPVKSHMILPTPLTLLLHLRLDLNKNKSFLFKSSDQSQFVKLNECYPDMMYFHERLLTIASYNECQFCRLTSFLYLRTRCEVLVHSSLPGLSLVGFCQCARCRSIWFILLWRVRESVDRNKCTFCRIDSYFFGCATNRSVLALCRQIIIFFATPRFQKGC
jgi:hypothetical protein